MPYLWLDIVFLSLTAIISFALSLISFSFGPRRILNLTFSIFTLARAIQASLGIILRLALWTGRGNALLLSELTIPPYIIVCVGLMLFTTRFVKRDPKWTDGLAYALLVVALLILKPLFQGQLISATYLSPLGTQNATFTPLGNVLQLVPILALTWSLILFWQERHQAGGTYMALSVLIMLAGPIFGAGLKLPFPITSITSSISVVILGYGVLRHQLFNPLKERTLELQREVNERVKAETAQQRSEDMYRRAIMVAGAVPYYLDQRSRTYTFMGEGILPMTGYSASEMTPDLWLTLEQERFPRGNLAHLSYAEADRLTEQDITIPWECDYRIRTRAGGMRWVADTSVKILNEQGKRVGIIGILQDITDRKLTEQALERYTDQLEMLREIDHAILALHSPEETALAALTRIRRIVPCRRAGVALFNLETEQSKLLAAIYGETQELGTEPVSFEAFGIPALTCLKQGQPYVIEDVLAGREIAFLDRKLAEEGIHSWLMVPLLDQGRLIGSLNLGRLETGLFSEENIAVAKDVADQLTIAIINASLYKALRTANTELEQRVTERTAQLETANKDLEAFSFSVSHDLRAPLRAIYSFSRILMEDFAEKLEPQAQQFLTRVQENALKMNRLIDGLLTFSRAGRQAISRRETDLKAMVQEIFNELRETQPRARQIEFTLGELPIVPVDPTLFKQVLSNLIDNAIKYTGKRDVSKIEVGTLHVQDEAVIFIRDNGTGFDMKYADRLFGVFQRLHSEVEFEGTGVGLSTVARIIQKHGGRIWAEAEPEKGATFYFTLGNTH